MKLKIVGAICFLLALGLDCILVATSNPLWLFKAFFDAFGFVLIMLSLSEEVVVVKLEAKTNE